MNVPLWSALPAVALCLSATAIDMKTRRIPNALTGTALLLALIAHVALRGPSGLGDSALGALVAGGLMLPGWLFKWKGGGDVKLVAAVGAWLGFPAGLMAALLSLVAGGLVAFVYAVRHRVLRQSLFGVAMLGSWLVSSAGKAIAPPATGTVYFPFGVAVLIGTLIALWVPS